MSVGGRQGPGSQQPLKGQRKTTRGRVVALGSLILVAALAVVIVIGAGSRNPAASTQTASATQSSKTTSPSSTRGRAGMASVPILVYHVINRQPSVSSASPALYVPADEFSSQLEALKANGWRAVTLDQVQAYWTRGRPLGPGKPIVVSFDNGYASHYSNALPVLKRLGWAGVENLQLTGLPPSDGGLTDNQIRGLIGAGWELDTQGVSHTDLTTLDAAQLSNDLSTARRELQRRYGAHVNWFSYPAGDYNPTVTAAVRAAGYLGAMTVNPGWASPHQDRFRLPRLVVTGGTTPAQLLAQIAAAQTAAPTPTASDGTGLA